MKNRKLNWLIGALLLAALFAVVWQFVPEFSAFHLSGLSDLTGGGTAFAMAGIYSSESGVMPDFVELRNLLVDSKKRIEESAAKTEAHNAETFKEIESLRSHVDHLRKSHHQAAEARGRSEQVSSGCAEWLAGLVIQAGFIQGKLNSHKEADLLQRQAANFLGLQQKAALTSTDIPLPTDFGKQVVELVWKYGQARQYGTVVPLGALTTQMPRLKTSPAFGFIDISTSVPEKSPQFEFVTFTALKAGGLLRVPSEIDADSAVALGQWLAIYCAREWAKWEDTTFFLADGSATYKTRSGVMVKAGTLGKKLQLTAGNSNASTITIANLRAIRAIVDAAALGTSAYYMHPSMEAHLSSLNTSTYVPYIASGPNGPTFEGYPIRWIGVLPVYSTTTALNQYQIAFGDLSYWYFGERAKPEIAVSRDVFFATDEIALRALERFDIGLMADASMSVLQLAAS